MKIISIEPTPSPNTMKIILNEEIPMGKSTNYKKEHRESAPPIIGDILNIDGIKGVYHVADFLAVERNSKFDWKDLLQQIRKAFGDETEQSGSESKEINEHYGEINVFVQMFKDIPMQIKLTDGSVEKRFGLPEVFSLAISKAEKPGDNVVMMRKWKDYGVRYGELEHVGSDLVEEIAAAYPPERLEMLVNRTVVEKEASGTQQTSPKRIKLTEEKLKDPDWKVRYQLLEQMDTPTIEDLPLLNMALMDEKPSIRRLATVYLGMIEDKAVLPYLYKALKDKTVTVRRTAGDCLSDLGFEEASEQMTEALKDDSKLVRWRAAMFLYEVGNEKALPALKDAENDREFEVSLQIKMAIERIEGGQAAKGSVWKQMTEVRKGTTE
ncbi:MULTISPECIES: conserved virulence factor C family protein [unclassified Bacillus (in: firmicutes)]|uniref:conserved virulence factor C family protein n=1 Tax=unclassified Bacillus (in: firmicutes) TaxID=185979 RepID=UPI0008EEC1F2|nr:MULTISPECIES: conserved virulence factor C family protein [unclassified Bacillus (in: firmicutes)]SFB25776.1 PBS lyase HEAT-like repeat-containing protein [Bacillus sp. UNCCL13]SFQ91832.1 PBS lyase HEAT-like repeat-containing protein [Bacillus sp. cl95]